jgi:hypothetical protein
VSVAEQAERSRARRADRFRARDVLRTISHLERCRQCGWTGCDEDGVTVKMSGTESTGRVAGFGGVATCGSVWACPVCVEKIQAKRRDELVKVCDVAAARGCTPVLVTLTLRHTRADPLVEVWDDLSKAWAAVNRSGPYRRGREAWGYVGHVRATEVLVGPNGWHVHAHALFVLDWHGGEEPDAAMTDEDAQRFGELLWRPWSRYLSRKPGRDPVRAAFDVRVGRGAVDRMGEYLVKAEFRTSWEGLAAEATMSAHKSGRKANRTPFQVLADIVERTAEITAPDGQTALTGRSDDAALLADLALWSEWERGSKGRRQLEWSRTTTERPGLRDWAGLGEEQTDEEAAAEELGGEAAVLLPRRTWAAVRRRAWEVLDVAERGGVEGLTAWLDAAELAWIDLTPHHEGVP